MECKKIVDPFSLIFVIKHNAPSYNAKKNKSKNNIIILSEFTFRVINVFVI